MINLSVQDLNGFDPLTCNKHPKTISLKTQDLSRSNCIDERQQLTFVMV